MKIAIYIFRVVLLQVKDVLTNYHFVIPIRVLKVLVRNILVLMVNVRQKIKIILMINVNLRIVLLLLQHLMIKNAIFILKYVFIVLK